MKWPMGKPNQGDPVKRSRFSMEGIAGKAVVQVEIDGYDPNVSGLIVHKRYLSHGGEWKPVAGAWDVSHIESGQRINRHPFRKRDQAEHFASALADLTDWTLAPAALRDQGEMLSGLVLIVEGSVHKLHETPPETG